MTDRDRETLRDKAGGLMLGCGIVGMSESHGKLQDLLESLLERLEAAERARDTQSGVVAKLIIRERQLEEECSRLRANMGLGETIPHCSDCGVLLHCEGSQREHEWEWHRRYKEAEAHIDAALALHYCAFDVSHTEAFDDATCACGAVWTKDGCQSPTVKALMGEGE